MLAIKAALAGTVACALATTAALAEPKTNMLHQWSEGSDAAAIAKLLVWLAPLTTASCPDSSRFVRGVM